MAVKQLTRTTGTPVGGARLRKPNGDIYLQLPETTYNPEVEGETRKINSNTGYWVKKVNESDDNE